MKKFVAVIAVVAVVCVAGAAFAQTRQTRGRNDARRMPPQLQKEFAGEQGHLDQRMPEQRRPDQQNFGRPEGFDGAGCRFGHRGGRLGFTPDMPEEIRAKAVEAAKLRIDLEAVMSAKPLDKAKAVEIFGKIQQTENEVKMWKFENRLNMMEKAKIMRELNKISKPAPKPQAPAPEE